MGTGIRDLRGVICDFKHDFLFSDLITAGSGFNFGGLQSETTTSNRNGFLDIEGVPLFQTPSDTISDSGAPSSFASLLSSSFSYDHLFSDENALSSLELGGPPQLGLPDVVSGVPPPDSAPNSNLAPSSCPGTEEDSEIFSDIVLNYIDRMLMEENNYEKLDPGNPALVAAEQPFYDILGEELAPSLDQPSLLPGHSSDSPEDSTTDPHGNSNIGEFVDNSWLYDPVEQSQLETNPVLIDYSSSSSFSSTNSFGNLLDGIDEPFLSVSDLLTQSQQAWQFQKGLEEARKFLPSDDLLVIDVEANGFNFPQETRAEESKLVEVREEHEDKENPVHPLRGRKNRHGEDLDLEEGRSNKQSALSSDETHRTVLFDEILLCNGEKCAKGVDKLRVKLQNEVSKIAHSHHSKGSSTGKGRGKKQPKREVVDLRTLLIHCAQAVAADDHWSANESLKHIRQHSSPHGDSTQRLAHWFADGLQARLAGTGSQVYHSLVEKRSPVTEILKAYQLYLAACPFKKISHFFSTQTILNVAEKASKLHIIDFGLYYGFQWPCFMQRLASRPGGPPKLRMTGIDIPVHGFRPTELTDETGQRLADYARSFNIPFEFHAIATKWDTIRVEDLRIEKDEVLIVNCLYQFRILMDESVVVDSPRDKVLNTIRKINPDVFIHGVLNGTYGAPFFVTRFREALFHFSSLFDMIETNVPHEDEQRQLIEKVLFGREAINVISCEGTERVERPETYKQWQVRNLRAGFTQLPVNRDILKKAKDRVKSCYHKDFIVDEDSQWLLQGWKGRTIYALSTWRPNDKS